MENFGSCTEQGCFWEFTQSVLGLPESKPYNQRDNHQSCYNMFAGQRNTYAPVVRVRNPPGIMSLHVRGYEKGMMHDEDSSFVYTVVTLPVYLEYE